MSHSPWTRQENPEEAATRILDAAGELFAERGVAATTMTEIRRRAGCSRATLYRYFPTRRDLHLAFVDRAVLDIAAQLRGTRPSDPSGDPVRDLTDRIVRAVAAVRADPAIATWFEPDNVSVPLSLGNSPSVLREMMSEQVRRSRGAASTAADRREQERAAKWLLRNITSLLANPYETAMEERAAVETFIVPSFLAVANPAPRSH